ncbi:uncharacterized protein EDB93DRAFT_1096847 [Suillus bovinus]|uniref:uncharacterized protein n=1 Tax=Suillus bovinus TaxID=48563 RepID=UPI001B87637B|nr:uncharacterized protein EDB93DRAFT_1096847 [Suillus bovinus]KAG2126893.1 hypothetical protein EDB93DRAFT_1096847 [Suillus bovinus]
MTSDYLPRTTNFDTHMRMGHPIVFSLIIFCSIIVLSISAWLTSCFTAYDNYFSIAERDRTRFLLFTSAWTIVFSSLYMLFFFCLPGSVLGSVASHIFFLFLTFVFWTAGATSITILLGEELNRNTQGHILYLDQLNALQGFSWVTEALVTFALVAVLICGILGSGHRDNRDNIIVRLSKVPIRSLPESQPPPHYY